MVNYIYQFLKYCQTSPKEGTAYCHPIPLKLFPTMAPLAFVAFKIVRSFPKSSEGNHFVVFTTNRYSKLIKTIPTAKITAGHIAHIVLNHWVILYGILDYLLSDDGPNL